MSRAASPMAGPAPVELTLDCPLCRLEGGVVEIYDARVPACRFGLPASTRCKLCGGASEGVFDRPIDRPLREIPANRCPACSQELTASALDEHGCAACGARATLREVTPGASFALRADLERALDAWAEREQFASRDALVAATFPSADVGAIFEALQRGAPIEVIADPFANMGVRAAGRAPDRRGSAPSAPLPATTPAKAWGPVASTTPAASTTPVASTTPIARPLPLAPPSPRPAPRAPPPPTLPPPSAPPRAIVYPLVSVIAADGEIHPEERALIDRFLQGEGLPPLSDDEICVHHPSAVAHLVPRTRREDVVKLMCETAAIDGMPDESERRVIRAYATAWSVDDEKLEFWMWGYENMNTSPARALWLKLRRFVLSARWSEHEPTPG